MAHHADVISEIWVFEGRSAALVASHEARPDAAIHEQGQRGVSETATPQGLTELRARVARARDAGEAAFLWIDLVNATEYEMTLLGDLLDLPGLQIEDTLHQQQRPKVERDGLNTFLVLRAVNYLQTTQQIETHQVSAFAGPGYLVTITTAHYDLADSVMSRLRRDPELMEMGTAAGLYAMLDVVTDGYLSASLEIAEDISEIEEAVFDPNMPSSTERIYLLKRENLELRRAVAPLLSTARSILAGNETLIAEPLLRHYQDVADHLLRVSDTAESNDQLLMTLLMAVTTLMDYRQNDDMRRISAYAAMGIVPTVIAGIYGMNFKLMPELDEWWGYPFALSLMAGIVLLLFRAFKKSGWL